MLTRIWIILEVCMNAYNVLKLGLYGVELVGREV